MSTWKKVAAVIAVALILLVPALFEPVLMIAPLRNIAMLVVAGFLATILLNWWQERSGKTWARAYGIIAETSLGLAVYHAGRIIAAALAIGMVLGSIALVVAPAPAAAAGAIPSAYDKQIQQTCQEFLPDTPWRLCKAQWFQESRLDPKAVSPAGAAGLVQLMPGTAEDVRRALGYATLDRHSIEPALRAGSYYMAKLKRSWSAPRPWWDRHALALASFNAGFGNILQAQARCGDPALYEPIVACLPQVTGRHAAETLGYAPRIRRWWMMLEAGA